MLSQGVGSPSLNSWFGQSFMLPVVNDILVVDYFIEEGRVACHWLFDAHQCCCAKVTKKLTTCESSCDVFSEAVYVRGLL